LTVLRTQLPPQTRLVRATPSDNAAILEFMRGQAMRAGLSMRFDRSPDYFALHEAHSEDHETWLLVTRDRIIGIGSIVSRNAWVDGAIEPVIYLADLRLAPGRATAGVWRPLLRDVLRDARARTGAKLAYCSIIRDNKSARQAMLRDDRVDSTPFRRLRGYASVAIIARKPCRGPNAAYAVRHATAGDANRLQDFIAEQSRSTQFGVVFDTPAWSRRLVGWPDFGIENFLIAQDEREQIVGCVAPWNYHSINRIVIERLPPAIDAVRMLCNMMAPLTRRPLIRVGARSSLPDAALTHLFIRNRNPSILSALLHRAVRQLFSTRRYATISLIMYDDDPLAPALRDFWCVSVPMDLYWVDVDRIEHPTATPRELDSGIYAWPGFESYLV